MSEDWGYEVLPVITDETGTAELAASHTANNGIRIGIINRDDDTEEADWFWREFDFTPDQAELIGHALVRWAASDRKNSENTP